MTILLSILALLAVFAVVAFLRLPLWLSTLTFALTIGALGSAFWATPALVSVGLGFLLIAGVLNIAPLRRKLFTAALFNWFSKVLPPLSDTEREAIDAGGTWFDSELFSGRPKWSKLTNTPPQKLSEEEQQFLNGPTRELCEMLDDWQIRNDKDLPEEIWAFIKKKGFLGMIIPKEYGGKAFSTHAQSEIVMRIASRNLSAAVTVMVPNSLGPGELLIHYGSKEQQDHYLPRLADGREVPCFALTGPHSGSDAASMPDVGIVCEQEWEGKKTLGLRVTWDKRYITLSPVATVLGLAFRAVDPDGLLGDKKNLGITCALIPTTTPGVEIGNRHLPVGAVFMNGPTQGKDVFIPMDYIIGGAERIGQGWRMLMSCLAVGRAISLPALGTAGGQLGCYTGGAYARVRKQFKQPIGFFEGVEEQLSTIAGYSYRMESTRRLTLSALDQGEKPVVLSAMLKYYLTEGNRTVTNANMDVHAGKGIILGPNNYLASAYESLPIAITVEGANILTRTMIVFGQGAIRCHPYILKEMLAAGDDDKTRGLKDFDKALVSHIGFSISNAVRSLILGITNGRLSKAPSGVTAPYFRRLNRLSALFAFTADLTLLSLGGAFKFKERLSGRLADALSHMYMAAATLKNFRDNGEAPEERPLMEWAVQDSLYQCEEALTGVIQNFPATPAGLLLRLVGFPIGRRYRRPDDKLGRQAARVLMTDNAARRRLTSAVHVPSDKETGLGALADAFEKVLRAEAAVTAISNALGKVVTAHNYDKVIAEALEAGIITEQQGEDIRAAEQASEKVIGVDDFSPQSLQQSLPQPEEPTWRQAS